MNTIITTEKIAAKQTAVTSWGKANILSWLALFVTMFFMGTTNCFAAGGLDEATDVMREIQMWIYTIDFVGAMIYLSYLGLMWFFGRKDASDFAIGIAMIAVIGGVIAAVTYAWSIWGTAV